MGKSLVLAEKPSVAREIARVLRCNKKGNSFFEGDKYIIIWGLGHLVELETPEHYGKQYEKWQLDTLPILPKKFELAVIKGTAKHFYSIRKVMERKDIDELIIATDAGREGELVARWIIEKANLRKPLKRLWISSQTDKAIKDGFANLKPGREYEKLFLSARCRAEADWLVGLNVTRALTCKHNSQLSAGRVQTPTLNMIVQREQEIRRFKPKDYWTITGEFNGFSAGWQDRKNGQIRIFDHKKAEDIVSKVKNRSARVIEIKKGEKKELPPLAYDLTELQRDANIRFNYSAKQTLSIMQALYERHKLVTYPRTDSRYITEDIVPTLKERLKSVSIGPYTAYASGIIKKGIKVSKRLVDNSKVSDHHAIIPTEQYVDLSSLDKNERNIYDLIVKRFIAVLSSPFIYEQTTVMLEIQDEIFHAQGKIVKSLGWKAVYGGIDNRGSNEDSDDDKDQSLPQLSKGDVLKLVDVKLNNRKTKPPARYTEATLLSAMEHPGKFIDDEKLKNVIEKTSGLGTPATRADIIEKLFNSFYIEKRGKELHPTSKGNQLIELVPEDLKSPELTAQWEQRLEDISKGKAEPENFVGQMKGYASKMVSVVISSTDTYKHDNMTREKCPECGKYLLDVNGKRGRMLVCQDRECGYRKSVSITTNARCPECHKKMELRGEGDKKSFYCACGFRERLSSFNERKMDKVNKKDVNSFMRNQKTEKNINSSLAEALKEWKKE